MPEYTFCYYDCHCVTRKRKLTCQWQLRKALVISYLRTSGLYNIVNDPPYIKIGWYICIQKDDSRKIIQNSMYSMIPFMQNKIHMYYLHVTCIENSSKETKQPINNDYLFCIILVFYLIIFKNFKFLFSVYFIILAVPGLHWCMLAFSLVAASRGYSLAAVCRLFIARLLLFQSTSSRAHALH